MKNATLHSSKKTLPEFIQAYMNTFWKSFVYKIISSGLWPACSPFFNPCDFYLWATVVQRIYRLNPDIFEEKKDKPKGRFYVSREL
jgi:hypothetical protein